ncbi:hypothetical protein HZ326_15089 [Fusarium oxysporum f. sp. albedinis]|nr:hypothetical protein HZ326_15089 [Fusarium oxysporum f. sp. albedinis]
MYQSMKMRGGKALMSMKNFLTYEYVVHEDKEPGSKRCPTSQQIWSLKSNRDPVPSVADNCIMGGRQPAVNSFK